MCINCLLPDAAGDIRVWNITSGDCLKVIEGHQRGIASIQIDKGMVVSAGSDCTIRVFDLETGTSFLLLSSCKQT
jgi:WD40 repeat protein